MDERDHEVRLLWLLGALLLSGCREAAAPQVSYLAIIPTILAPQSSVAGTRYHYRVRELSGEIPIDTVVTTAPTDTVILPLPPATYAVALDGVPPQCRVRETGERYVLIAANTNTTALRYFIVCQTQLVITVATDGPPNSGGSYVYRIATADGRERIGLVHTADTLAFEGLALGPATIDLAAVPARCVVVSNGGNERTVQLDSAGGLEVAFLVRCGDPIHRPRVLSFKATYHDGIAGVVFSGTDPDRDLERYTWDLTDCHRTSLTGASSTRGGLSDQGSRTYNRDTVTVVTVFDIGLPDSSVSGKCAALWLTDTQGNPSEIIEVPLGDAGQPPIASFFNAHLIGVDVLRTELTTSDPDGDFVGTYMQLRLRDGMVRPPDGQPDIAYRGSLGYLGSEIPDLLLGTGVLTYDNIYAVIVYIFDAQGNFTRLEDTDLFH